MSSTIDIGTEIPSGRVLGLPVEVLVYEHLRLSGQSGSGKTTTAYSYIGHVLRSCPEVHVAYVDLKGGKGEGADWLVNHYAPAYEVAGGLPLDITTIRPWLEYSVPLGLFAHELGVDLDVHAHAAVAQLEALLGERLGPRGRPIAVATTRSAISLGGNLLTLLGLLENPSYRESVIPLVTDQESVHFLRDVLPLEPVASVAAVASRVRAALALDRARATLSAPSSLRPADLMASRLTVVDCASGCPLGMEELSIAIAEWAFYLIGNAVMSKPSKLPHLLIVVDEWQRMRRSTATISRLMEQSRSFGASLHLCAQVMNPEPSLREVLAINTNLIALTPREEISELEAYLEVSGRMVDDLAPDHVLGRADERRVRLEALRRLGKREGVFVRRSDGRLRPFRLHTFPYARVAELARGASADARDRIARGRFGVAFDDLLARAVDPVALRLRSGMLDPSVPRHPTTRRPRPVRLVLP